MEYNVIKHEILYIPYKMYKIDLVLFSQVSIIITLVKILLYKHNPNTFINLSSEVFNAY